MSSGPATALRSLQASRLQLKSVESSTDAPLAVLYLPALARDRVTIRERIARAGASVTLAADAADAVQMLGSRRYGLVVVDLAGDGGAVATIRLLRKQFPAIPAIGVMDPADPVRAAEALQAGACDILSWPFDDRDAAAALALARDRSPVAPEADSLGAPDELFAHSAAMRVVADAVRAAGSSRAPMLVSGAPGSGRDLVARALHATRDEFLTRPFVRVDCAAESDLEQRLFGAEDGHAAAVKSGPEHVRRGSAIVAAQGGTLYLVNLLEAPARVQGRLAALLRDREALSLDVRESIRLAVRLVCSTGPSVETSVADGRLRKDLFDRLMANKIELPSFSQRREDLPLLAAMFLRRTCTRERVPQKCFSRAALSLLTALPWKSNADEMKQLVTRVVKATRSAVIQLDDVLAQASFDTSSSPVEPARTLREARARFERDCISATLIRHQGRMGEAARALGIQRTNLYRKVRQLKVPRSLFSSPKS